MSSISMEHIPAAVSTNATTPAKVVKKRNPIRKFTHQDIDQKVSDRAESVPNYRELLMVCAVHSDETGVDIDTSHPGWLDLLRTVTTADAKMKQSSLSQQPILLSLSTSRQPEMSSQSKDHPQATRHQPPSQRIHRFQSHEQWLESRAVPYEIYKKLEMELFLTPPSKENPQGVPDPNCRVGSIVKLCSAYGIPAKLRPAIWASLLGVHGVTSQSSSTIPTALPIEEENEKDASSIDSFLDADTLLSSNLNSKQSTHILKKENIVSTEAVSDPQLVSLDLENQRVIKVDIHRTLPQVPYFSSPGVQHLMEQLLTSYCKDSVLSYKQGLNYILAPFLLIRLPIFRDASNASNTPSVADAYPSPTSSNHTSTSDAMGEEDGSDASTLDLGLPFDVSEKDVVAALQNDSKNILACLKALVSRALPNTYSDTDFGALQCLLSLFRLLLQYHDPCLGSFLDANDMGPELYAASWFMTLHVNRARGLHVIVHLWDALLLELRADPLFHYMVALSLLVHHREEIMAEAQASLPEKLSKLAFSTVEQVDAVIANAKRLRALTPVCFSLQLHAFTSTNFTIDSEEYQRLSSSPSLSLSVDEMLSHCFVDDGPFATLSTTSRARGVSASAPTSLSSPSSASSSSPIADNTTPPTPSSVSSLNSPSFTPAEQVYPPIVYVALDCRPKQQFVAGHLPGSIHISPSLLQNPAALLRYTNALRAMQSAFEQGTPRQSVHFAFIGPSSSSSSLNTITPLLLHFVSELIEHISVVQGGYRAVHALVVPRAEKSRSTKLNKGKSDETLGGISQPFISPTGKDTMGMASGQVSSTSSEQGDRAERNLYMSTVALAPGRPSSASIQLIDHDPAHCVECLATSEESGGQGQLLTGAFNRAFGRFASVAQKVRTAAASNATLWSVPSQNSNNSQSSQSSLNASHISGTISNSEGFSSTSGGTNTLGITSSTTPTTSLTPDHSFSGSIGPTGSVITSIGSTQASGTAQIRAIRPESGSTLPDSEILPETLHLLLPPPGSPAEARMDCASGSTLWSLLLATSLRDQTVKGHEFRKTLQSLLPHLLSKCIAAGIAATSASSTSSPTGLVGVTQAKLQASSTGPIIPTNAAHKPNALTTFSKVQTNPSLSGGFSSMRGITTCTKVSLIAVAEHQNIVTRVPLKDPVSYATVLDHALRRGAKRLGPVVQFGFGRIELDIPNFPPVRRHGSSSRVRVRDQASAGYTIAASVLPGDLNNTYVVLFIPVLTPEEPDVGPIIEHIISKGVDPHSLCVLTLSTTQQSVWGLSMRYPDVAIVALSIDIIAPLISAVPTGVSNVENENSEEDQIEVSRIVPGIHGLYQRYTDDFSDLVVSTKKV